MEVPGIQAQERLVGGRVTQVKLVGAHGAALGYDPEKFALHGISVVSGIDLFGKVTADPGAGLA